MANERIEWTNVWREQADTDLPRVLFIGDSIIWGARKHISAGLPQSVGMSVFATSKGVDDPYFVAELELMIRQDGTDFRGIYFNSGLHTHGQTPEEYRENMRRVIAELGRLLPNVPMILGLSTPITRDPRSGAGHDTPITEREIGEKNGTVLAYNRELRKLSRELSLPVYDAYGLLEDKDEWKTDSYHYNNEGQHLFGTALAKEMISLLNQHE